ncbi:cutinase family protein [Gordonia cholesterolivorans]|uniref:Cutinase family protein n=1 Tax=Gordonia cholesterolivorans TaxID=559625 RepID=A0ABN3HC66_9ACTN
MSSPGSAQPFDFYRTLNLDPSAPPNALAAQLHQRISQTPPGPGRDQLQQALAILGDPAKRQAYDARLRNPQAPPWTPPELHQLALGVTGPTGPPAPPTRPGQPRPPAKSNRGRRILLFGGGAFVLIIILFIGLGAIVGGGSSSNCDDIVFIGAAGSSQRDGEKKAAEDGMGGYVNDTYKNLLSDANKVDKTVEVRVVDYPAAAVKPGTVASGEFTQSLNQGTDVATTMIKDAVAQCSDSKIVVAGYSQGAMVSHRALLAVEPSDRIIGMLIADGDRQPDDPNVLRGGKAAANTGISFTEWGQALSGITNDGLFPQAWKGRIISWCMTGDTVCSNVPGKIDFDFGAGAVTHMYGYNPNDWRPHLAKLALE